MMLFLLSDNHGNDKFTLGDAVCFSWYKQKSLLELADAVTAWAFSLHSDIGADCFEHLSTGNGDLRKLMEKVVAKLHYPPCPT